MNILVGGCSFSEPRLNNEIGWVDLLKNHVNITNLSKGGNGQSLIVNSIINELLNKDFKYDFVIVQLSAFGRGLAKNEKEFYESVIKQNLFHYLPHYHEYVDNNIEKGNVSSVNSNLDNSFVNNSLVLIYLLKNLLDIKNIKYKMFWGWEQLNEEYYHLNKNIIDTIYDNNFWRYGKHGGFKEWSIDKLGNKKALHHDKLHPSQAAHKLFYKFVLEEFLNKKEIVL